MFIRLFAVVSLILLVSAAAAGSAESDKRPFAFVIGIDGTVKVASEAASVGMAIYEGDSVSAAKNSGASILLIDDSLYKVGASKNLKIAAGLIKGDIKTFPKKDGTWLILYKKFQDRVKAQKDISQYGAVRSTGFLDDFSHLSKVEVKKLADDAIAKYELTRKQPEYFYVSGSIWEFHKYYSEALKIYDEGMRLYPESVELMMASSIVNAKLGVNR